MWCPFLRRFKSIIEDILDIPNNRNHKKGFQGYKSQPKQSPHTVLVMQWNVKRNKIWNYAPQMGVVDKNGKNWYISVPKAKLIELYFRKFQSLSKNILTLL